MTLEEMVAALDRIRAALVERVTVEAVLGDITPEQAREMRERLERTAPCHCPRCLGTDTPTKEPCRLYDR
jgi:hypothetical protein